MKRFILLLAFYFSLLAPSAIAQTEDQTARVEKIVLSFAENMNKGEYTKLLDSTYPGVIELMGGRQEAERMMEEVIKLFKQSGFRAEVYETIKPYQFIKGQSNQYVIVPIHSIMAFYEGRMEAYGYQIGVLSPGAADWTFIDGEKLTPELLKKILPDFPENVSLPEIKKQKLE